MEPDPNKKKDQNPQKPSIKIKQINIPENVRMLLNRGQGQGQGQGEGAGVRVPEGMAGVAAAATGAATGAAAAGASSLSSLDPFIKVVADSNRGIILMPVLSDVKFSIPPGSVSSFLGSSPSLPSSSPSDSSPGPSNQRNVSESTSFSQGKKSGTPSLSGTSRQSLSFPNFSSLSKAPSSARDSTGNLTPSTARSNVQDTDYASETANLTKGQILQQASTAMLAQANQMPNVILTLLK